MLCSPDPPREFEDGLSREGGNQIILDTEDSEDDTTITESSQFGYELLPQDMQNWLHSDNVKLHFLIFVEVQPMEGWKYKVIKGIMEGGNSDSEDATADDNTFEDSCSSFPTEALNSKEIIDMEVNNEEVRAAMRNITLPPSAIPPWATSVPESQWTSFLLSRMSQIQSNTNSHSSI